jgi:outer membrane protein TolC
VACFVLSVRSMNTASRTRRSFRRLALFASFTLPLPAVAFAQPTRAAGAEAAPVPSADDPMLAPVPPAQRSVATWKEAIETARARSTDLRTAYDAVSQAEGQQRTALGALLPQINATNTLYHVAIAADDGVAVSPTGQILSTATTTADVLGMTVQQSVLNIQQIYAFGTAKSAVDAARLSYDDLARTVAQGVANALVGVVTAERVADLNRIGLRQSLDRLQLTVEKRRLGAATDVDVVRANQDAAAARSTLVTGDEALRQAREALGLALGIPVAIGVSPALTLNDLPTETQQTCRPVASIEDRADLRAARANVEVARRRVTETWWQFAPYVSAQGTAVRIMNTENPPTTLWNIQATLTIPIWDGGQRYGLLGTNDAKLDAARQAHDAAFRQATIQVEQAKRGVSVAEDRLRVSGEARDLAAKNDELTQLGYSAGQMTSLDLVTAAAARRNAEVNYALTEFGLVRAKVAAILALANCR